MNSDWLQGVWSPALTPVSQSLEIDLERYAVHVKRLLDQGCHGVALFGTTGEATSFSASERMGALDAVLKAGVAPEQLLIGTGCAALADSVALTQHAASNGCLNVLMVPPFYYKGVSDTGAASSFSAVIDRVGNDQLGVYLYHFPKLSGVPITTGVIDILIKDYPTQIRGYKDSGGDFSNTEMLIKRYPGLNIFPGSERYLLPALRLGGVGCITATANVSAGPSRAVWDAWKAGDDAADDLQTRATAIRQELEQYALVPIQKSLLASTLNDDEWDRIRPPLDGASKADREQLTRALDAIDFKVTF